MMQKKIQYRNKARCLWWLCGLLPALLLGGCQQDELFDDLSGISSGKPGTLTVKVQHEDLVPANVTRASDPKTDAEKEIKQFYLFLFDEETGDYIKADAGVEAGEDRFYGFQTAQEGASVLNIDAKAISNEAYGRPIVVYAVANVEAETFTPNENGTCNEIENLEALRSYVYKPYSSPDEINLGLPETGMPMVGEGEVTIQNKNTGVTLTIQMQALMARIDVNLKIDSENEGEGNLPKLNMMEWKAVNLPDRVSFSEPAAGEYTVTNTGEGDTDDTHVKLREEITTTNTRTIYNGNGELELTFYMFENRRKGLDPKTDASSINWGKEVAEFETDGYPKGVTTEADKQRYKPCLKTEGASAVVIHGNYHTYNSTDGNASYDVTWTLYLGGNHTDNFEVKRNYQYKNDVTIKGLTQTGNNPEHVTFDARINIQTGNDYFISILREREHDAHFCVTPMDIYLFQADDNKEPNAEGQPFMIVTLGNDADENGQPWLRMERIPASIMQSGTLTSPYDGYYESSTSTLNSKYLSNDGQAWHAGTGKRRWFTTGLLQELDSNQDETKGMNGKTCTMYHRDRIYFYLDENLGDAPREAVVHFEYHAPDGTTVKQRDMTIRQVELLPVNVYNRNADGTQGSTLIQTVYMEQFEEYSQHYDPLDEYANTVYTGRTWSNTSSLDIDRSGIIFANDTEADNVTEGLNSVEWTNWTVGSSDEDHDDNDHFRNNGTFNWLEIANTYYHGNDVTALLCAMWGQLVMGMNDTPATAAQYCYNKNIRSEGSEGNVLPLNWHTAATREYLGLFQGYATYLFFHVSENGAKWFMPGIRQMEDAMVQYYSSNPSFQSDYYWSCCPGIGSDGDGKNTRYARATKIEGNTFVSSTESGTPGYQPLGNSNRVRAFRLDKQPMGQ